MWALTTLHGGLPSPHSTAMAFSRLKIPSRLGRIAHPESGMYFFLQVITSLTFLVTRVSEDGAAFPDSPGCSDTSFPLFFFHMPNCSLWSECSLSTLNKHFLQFTHNNSLDLGSQAVELCICIELIFTQQAAEQMGTHTNLQHLAMS